MPIATLLALLLLIVECACIGGGKLPIIPNHHWRNTMFGADLYDDSGKKVGTINVGPPGESTQVCLDIIVSCEYFETNQKALDWVADVYKERRP